MTNAPYYVEVILPLALKGTFTYQLEGHDVSAAKTGMRVLVQFGKNKLYSGIIHSLHQNTPEHFKPKTVVSILDDQPLVSELHLQFWKWISGYYMCTLGEVMHAALPSGLKLASKSTFRVSEGFDSELDLSDSEYDFLSFLREEKGITLDEVRNGPFGVEGIRQTRRLLEKGAVTIDQQIKSSYKPRKVTCIDLSTDYKNEQRLNELLDLLKKAPAQQKALEVFLQKADLFNAEHDKADITRQDIVRGGASSQAINGLLKKQVFTSYEVNVSRVHYEEDIASQGEMNLLTDQQEKALGKLRESFGRTPVALLQGVTSSGKTEVYIRLIQEQINQGKQVLYLLPEIAITTQIIKRLKKVFGEQIGVYHSKYSDSERVEVYRNISEQTDHASFSVILGVRSAIFLPFRNLGLIIVDEEHENTFKQFDPAPRYHARDAATILGMFSGARVLLGSATPSFESLHNRLSGKYGYAELNERYGDIELPEVIIADIAQAKKRKQLKTHFTPELISGIENAMNTNQQVILFQNRRGYSNYLQCNSCSHILKCTSCDVSLTYHKYNNEMSCHYCGYRIHVPSQCPECSDPALSMRGFGTEKIEDEIALLFPDISIGRLDLDKTRSRKAFEKVISDFEKGNTQILVGTQMVTKGLDFENVGLVGIVDADSMLNFPDFRAFERSYQLMIQVSGRAGRRKKRGKVIIQTMDPEHPVIKDVLNDNFQSFFEAQMEERKIFKYPPYVRMIRLMLRHEIPSILDAGAVFLANELREAFGSRVLGPQPPMVARTHGKHIRQIILKIEKEASFEKSKSIISTILELLSGNNVYRQIRITVDVDPL